MPKDKAVGVSAAQLRKDTEEWLTTRTIPTMRAIARELENAGEDVHSLLAAIQDLETVVHRKPAKAAGRAAKARQG